MSALTYASRTRVLETNCNILWLYQKNKVVGDCLDIVSRSFTQSSQSVTVLRTKRETNPYAQYARHKMSLLLYNRGHAKIEAAALNHELQPNMAMWISLWRSNWPTTLDGI